MNLHFVRHDEKLRQTGLHLWVVADHCYICEVGSSVLELRALSWAHFLVPPDQCTPAVRHNCCYRRFVQVDVEWLLAHAVALLREVIAPLEESLSLCVLYFPSLGFWFFFAIFRRTFVLGSAPAPEAQFRPPFSLQSLGFWGRPASPRGPGVDVILVGKCLL